MSARPHADKPHVVKSCAAMPGSRCVDMLRGAGNCRGACRRDPGDGHERRRGGPCATELALPAGGRAAVGWPEAA